MGQGAPTRGWRPQRWAGGSHCGGRLGLGAMLGLVPSPCSSPGTLGPSLGLVSVGLFPAGGLHLWGGSAPHHPPQMCKVPKCLNHLQGETEARGLKQGISSWGPRSPVPGCGGLPRVTWGGGSLAPPSQSRGKSRCASWGGSVPGVTLLRGLKDILGTEPHLQGRGPSPRGGPVGPRAGGAVAQWGAQHHCTDPAAGGGGCEFILAGDGLTGAN